DPLGNLSQTTNARGQAINNTYNSMGQLTQEIFANGAQLSYSYDIHGNLVSASDGTSTTTFQYDSITEDLLQVNYPGGRFLKFTYDAASRRAQSVDQNGLTVNYLYDATGRLAGLQDGAGGRIVSYTYDSTSQLIRKDMGNGTFTTYAY